MTVAVNDRLSGPTTGDGSTTAFAYDFYITANTELRVILRSTAGIDTVKELSTHYTVTGVGAANGGTVVFLTAPALNEKVIIEGLQPKTQTTTYTESANFPAESHQGWADKTGRTLQELQRDIDRAVKYPHGETTYRLPIKPASETKVLGQNTDGEIVHLDIADISPDALALAAGWLDLFGLPAAGALDNLGGVRFVADLAALKALVTATGRADDAAYRLMWRVNPSDRGGGAFHRTDDDMSATLISATKTVASVNTGTDVITSTSHGFATGQGFLASVADAGLSLNTVYYAGVTGANTLTAHTTIVDAIAGTNKVNITTLVGSLSLRKLVDPKQAVYIISTGDDLDGSDGCFVRDFVGPTWSEWWGTTRDATGNNSEPLNAFLAYIALVRADGQTSDGEFPCSTVLYWDLTTVESGERCPTWRGAGATTTKITTTLSGLNIVGDVLDNLLVADMLFRGPGTLGTSDGIVFDAIPLSVFDRVDVFNYRYGVDGTDSVSQTFRSCHIRGNLRGVRLRTSGSGDQSTPNAVHFDSCNLGDNTEYGALIADPGLVRFTGGAVEGVGTSTTTGWGIKVTEVGGAAVGVFIDGVLFEGNKGLADVIIAQTAGAVATVLHSITNCSFTRHEPAANQFVTNNILITQTGGPAMKVLVSGGFQLRGAYVEDAARRYIVAPAGVVEDVGCQFASATARPNGNIFRKWDFSIDSAGAAISLPKDWTCVRNSAGSYTVTHNLNLGTTTYSVVGTVDVSSLHLSSLRGLNVFDYVIKDAADVATDGPAQFHMAILDN